MATVHLSPVSPAASTITGKHYRLTILTDGLIRYEWSDDGQFEDRASTFAVNRELPTPEFTRLESEGSLEILTSRFHLDFDKKAFSPSGFNVLLNTKLGNHSSRWRHGLPTSNLGGTARTLDDVNGRCTLGDGVLSRGGFAVVDDSASMLLTADGWVGPRVPGRSDSYLFAYGHDYRAALKVLFELSGPPPILPRWAFGNWWSRYYPFTADEYLKLMDRFARESIPLSVSVLDIDWHLIKIPPQYGTGWTGYTWNKDLFPDPAAFMRKLHDRNLQVTLNTHPADGVRAYEALYEKMARAMGRDPSDGHVLAFDCTDRTFMDAYFNVLHHALEDEGVDFWWLDWQQGRHSKIPGIDPLWMLNHLHFLDSGRDSKRPMTFSRYAGPGSHRYPIGFSGDTHVTWESLQFQPEFTATASNVGYGWWSHDVGGHFHGYKDDELSARWVQLGVWSPILRLHSSQGTFNSREPWRYGDDTRRIMVDCLRLRHRLLPYLYSMSVRATLEGTSLVEPMYYDHPAEAEAYKHPNQFRFGSQLLVSPITTPRDKSTGLGAAVTWLPAGRYIDIFTGAVYDGNRVLPVHRTLDKYPVFAQEGGIVPFDASDTLANGCPIPASIELLVVVGADGHFELVEDDGTGCDVGQIKFSRTLISYDQQSAVLTIAPASEPLVEQRQWSVRLLAYTPSAGMTATHDGEDLALTLEPVENGTLVHLGVVPSEEKITLRLGTQSPALDIADLKAAVFTLLEAATMELDVKQTVWNTVGEQLPLQVLLSRVAALDLDPAVHGAVLELLLADCRR